jgi:pimeloyl-ACP methyl ester carboxylesterase
MKPTNVEALERYGIEVVLMSGVGHIVMMEDPETFNALISEAISDFVG